MSFEGQIQQWVSIDNQLKGLNEKVKELRDKKNVLSENITKYASTNNLSNATVQISDGKLKFTNTISSMSSSIDIKLDSAVRDNLSASLLLLSNL